MPIEQLQIKQSSSWRSTNLNSAGFTLIEVMIVVAILGILAAIAYPSYQQYVIKSKRTDMMSEMHNIAAEIESRKLAQGSYSNIPTSDLANDYPRQGSALYKVIIEPDDPLTSKWKITADPIQDTQMDGDGALTLNHQGQKCREINGTCDPAIDWN